MIRDYWLEVVGGGWRWLLMVGANLKGCSVETLKTSVYSSSLIFKRQNEIVFDFKQNKTYIEMIEGKSVKLERHFRQLHTRPQSYFNVKMRLS
jgi:hypothetical protein